MRKLLQFSVIALFLVLSACQATNFVSSTSDTDGGGWADSGGTSSPDSPGDK